MQIIDLRARALALMLVVLGSAPGCATRGTMEGTGGMLTYQEMEDSGATNLYDAIDRLRPRWLQMRSSRSLGLPHEIVVYRGPSYLGSVGVLRTYPVGTVTHVEYLDSATAAATLTGYGSRHVEGAIILHWRAEGPPRAGLLPFPASPIVAPPPGNPRFPPRVVPMRWKQTGRSA
jgi:hypothetical protein